MSKANLFNREVRANKSPRNAYDMGYSTLFSSPCGQLLPIYREHVKDGDKIELKVSNLTRTRPVNTAAFMSFDEKVDFWFVPYRLIWSDYKYWQVAQTYRHRTTNLVGVGAQNYLPFTSFNSVADFFEAQTEPSQELSRYFTARAVTAIRYLDFMLYGFPNIDDVMLQVKNDTVYSAADVTNPLNKIAAYYRALSKVSPMNYFDLAAFQCIYMHSYRNEEYEEIDPSFYNVDNLFTNLVASNAVDSTAPAMSSPSYLLGMTSHETTAIDKRLSMEKLFTPRFKNWRKDIFTAAKPNAGFNTGITGLQIGTNAGGSVPLTSATSTYGSGFYDPFIAVGNRLPDAGSYPAQADINPGDTSLGFNPLHNPDGSTSYDQTRRNWTYQFNSGNPADVVQRLVTTMNSGSTTTGLTFLYPQNIRNLMAQDKFSRAAIYADKDLGSQIKALFGENWSDPDKPQYLGSYSTNLNIDDVMATSDGMSEGSDSILGQLAGKVKEGGNGHVFERSFNDDGVVIGVHYVMPRNNYDSNRLDKWNTKISRFDYYFPQFDGLGYQPILAYERGIEYMYDGIEKSSSLFGFGPRYYEYKQRVNEVHGAFMFGQADDSWTLSNNGAIVPSADSPQVYKILPDITDRIFTVEYDGSPATDPFQHYYYFDVTKVSDMEIYGTPSL